MDRDATLCMSDDKLCFLRPRYDRTTAESLLAPLLRSRLLHRKEKVLRNARLVLYPRWNFRLNLPEDYAKKRQRIGQVELFSVEALYGRYRTMPGAMLGAVEFAAPSELGQDASILDPVLPMEEARSIVRRVLMSLLSKRSGRKSEPVQLDIAFENLAYFPLWAAWIENDVAYEVIAIDAVRRGRLDKYSKSFSTILFAAVFGTLPDKPYARRHRNELG